MRSENRATGSAISASTPGAFKRFFDRVALARNGNDQTPAIRKISRKRVLRYCLSARIVRINGGVCDLR